MALTIDAQAENAVGIEEYLDLLTREVDVDDTDALLATASTFAGLLNNSRVMVDALNNELKRWKHFQNRNHYSAQTFVLGTSKKFVLRANVWTPPSKDAEMREWEDKFYYYRVPHDHNFSFMTGGYYGAGYETTIYEYEHDQVVGRVNEPVRLAFLERTTLPKGKIMFYRASKDIHSQEHPEDFSISINVLCVNPTETLKTQYQFDLEAQMVTQALQNTSAAQRMLCRVAAHVGDGETADLLDTLSQAHENPRFRVACLESLALLEPSHSDQWISRAISDKHPLVRAVGEQFISSGIMSK